MLRTIGRYRYINLQVKSYSSSNSDNKKIIYGLTSLLEITRTNSINKENSCVRGNHPTSKRIVSRLVLKNQTNSQEESISERITVNLVENCKKLDIEAIIFHLKNNIRKTKKIISERPWILIHVAIFISKIRTLLKSLGSNISNEEKCDILKTWQEELNNIFSALKSLNVAAADIILLQCANSLDIIKKLLEDENYAGVVKILTSVTIISLRFFLIAYFNVPCVPLFYSNEDLSENETLQKTFVMALDTIKQFLPEEMQSIDLTSYFQMGIIGFSVLAKVLANDPALQETLGIAKDRIKEFLE